MTSYTLRRAPVVRFGEHVSDELGKLLPASCRRVLFLTGRHASSHAERLRGILTESGREVLLIRGVTPEPPPDEVDRIVQSARDFRADSAVALGGGSVIDAAKAAAALIPAEGTCMEHFSGLREIVGEGVFFAALPTTSGTGAEMTNNSVLTDPATKIKKSLRSPFMTPSLALVDPLLTHDAPPALTAACGLDAFVQAAESYTSLKANSYTKALALTALKKIADALPKAFADGSDAAARALMAEGSMLTGLAFSQSGLGAVHGLAHPVGSLRHVPHGVACAILMTTVFRFNAETVPEPYAEMARALGVGDTAEDFTEFAARLAGGLMIPRGFSSFGLTRADFPFIVKNCRSGSMSCNPRPVSDADAEGLLSGLL